MTTLTIFDRNVTLDICKGLRVFFERLMDKKCFNFQKISTFAAERLLSRKHTAPKWVSNLKEIVIVQNKYT